MKNLSIVFLLASFFSCTHQSSKKDISSSDFMNKQEVYKLVDSINNLDNRYDIQSIKKMSSLYHSKLVHKMELDDAYSDVGDYFLLLFYEENYKLYDYLSKEKDTIVLKSIKNVISSQLDLSSDYIENYSTYIDSIFENHLYNNSGFKKEIDYIFDKKKKIPDHNDLTK